jgi:hypothetical protein
MSNNYTINGNEYPRVTHMLRFVEDQSGLLQWVKKTAVDKYHALILDAIENGKNINAELQTIYNMAMHADNDVKEEAMELGTKFHDILEHHIKSRMAGSEVDMIITDQTLLQQYQNFLDWEYENRVEWLESEKTVYHDIHCYAGTLDFICKINGKTVLGDFKLANQSPQMVNYQLAAYKCAIEHMTDYEIDETVCLLFDKKEMELKVKKSRDPIKNVFTWLKICDLWYSLKNRRVKNDRTDAK